MRLFHGSTVTVKRPNIQKARKATDFGKGFYTTTNFEQAKKWALLKKNREQSEKAIVSVYEVPDDILDREYPVLRFMGATKEWLEFRLPAPAYEIRCPVTAQALRLRAA